MLLELIQLTLKRLAHIKILNIWLSKVLL